MKVIKKIFLLALLFLLGIIIFAFGYYFAVTKNVQLSPEKLLFSEKTLTIYDENGDLARGISTAILRQSTPISDIPQHTQNAFVDIEDRRFFRHHGYDLKGIARATLHNLQSRSLKEGASTISQQLIKNTHLSQEKTLKRKLKEWKLTRALEKKYDKKEILERYLNTIYFGHSCFGITSAAEFYFRKTPSELTLADSAILAGLVKSPNNYSPFKNPENCRKRKSVVLSAMLRNGSVTKEEKRQAESCPLPTSIPSQNGYAQFIFDELTELAETHNFKIAGKIEIFTYLDQELQNSMEQIGREYDESDKTMLALDCHSGGFKACVSTVGNIPRLPGSLLKPLLVYAPAIEENILSPATPILDEKINYAGYSPENYDGTYHGYVSARECVEKSLNVPAVKILESLTVKKGVSYLEKLGLPVLEEDQSLALALGGMKKGYPLRDIVAAYSALQNDGRLKNCNFIASVKINGSTVYKRSHTQKEIFTEETASLMTDILKTTAKVGTAKKLRSLPFEIAAKTGTVGTKNGNTDAYALSYTTKDCVAVWLGNGDNSFINCTGGGTPCYLLHRINQELYERYQRKNERVNDFRLSDKLVRVDLDKQAYYDTHTLSLADELSPKEYRFSELFKKSATPLNKSLSFSNPTIVPPSITLTDNGIKISFDPHNPVYYRYKIDRYDYATHTTVYDGTLIPYFIDENLQENKNYVYTVIPYYQTIEGAPITLPTITTKAGESPTLEHDEILSKEWWQY